MDWSRDEFCQSLHENPGQKPVLFVSKAIMIHTDQLIKKTDRNKSFLKGRYQIKKITVNSSFVEIR